MKKKKRVVSFQLQNTTHHYHHSHHYWPCISKTDNYAGLPRMWPVIPIVDTMVKMYDPVLSLCKHSRSINECNFFHMEELMKPCCCVYINLSDCYR